MRVFLSVAMTVIAVAGLPPQAVYADTGATGGAALGVIDPAMEAKSLAKLTTLAVPSYSLSFETIGPGPAAAGDQIGPDYAQIEYPVWMEPQASYAANWCGPGSSSAVVSRWATMQGYADPVPNWAGGKDGYMAYLAGDLGEIETCCDGQTCYDCTTFAGMARVTNTQTNLYAPDSGMINWYLVSHRIHDLDHYKAMLWLDLHDYQVPLIAPVDTTGLTGWSYGIAHWVTIRQFWFGGNTTTYGDPAGPVQSGSTSSNGFHVEPLNVFYASHIRSLYNRVVW